MRCLAVRRTTHGASLTAASLVLLAGLTAAKDPSDTARAKSAYSSDVTIESRFLERGFVPDGNVSKPGWKRAQWLRCDRSYTGETTYPEAETEVATLWTREHIYFAYRAKYTTLSTYEGEDPTKERWELWERDVVEVFINPRPENVNRYYEFEVAPNNQWLDLEIDLDKNPFTNEQWDSGFEHATRVDEKARVWTCEFRIPLAAMKVAAIEPGDEWRLNFYRMDGREGGKPKRLMSWSPIPAPNNGYHTPTRFGIVRFVK